MFNEIQTKAIRASIGANELGGRSPYKLSFAQLGSSGASFGTFQGDTNVNPLARSVLGQVLRAAQIDDVTIGRITTELSKPCPNGSPLTPADENIVNNALSSSAGRAIVDAMDNQLLQTVLTRTQTVLDIVSSKGWTIAPTAILYIALWVNMTGAPDLLCKWIAGQTVFGLAPPLGPTITDSDIQKYLEATTYFQLHPRNFEHFKESIAAGAQILAPAAPLA